MSCGPRHGWAHDGSRRAEVERVKQQQKAMWTAALSGAVSGAVSGARGGAASQVRVGDAERDSAVAALSEHYVAGRLTKEELDERTDAAWTARTGHDLATLFHDLPQLPPPTPVRPPRRQAQRRAWRLGARLSWVFAILLVLAITGHVPWLVFAVLGFLWWTGLFSGLRRWTHARR